MTGLWEKLGLMRRRVADDHGSVAILMALVIFTVVGMLMMTWNTVQLSKEKMRLQNAADSAALAHCVWQARGLNTVQNINDEMYAALSTAEKLLRTAMVFEGIAMAAEAMSGIPFVGKVFMIIAQAMHLIALTLGGTSGWLAQWVCPLVLSPLGKFYVYGSCGLGLWSAMQLAGKNRADPLTNAAINLGPFGRLGLYAVGVSLTPMDTIKLPLQEFTISESPWVNNYDRSYAFKRSAFWSKIHSAIGTGKPWSFKPWVSEGYKSKNEIGRRPTPSVWIAHKYYTHIETLPLDLWKKDFANGIRKMPMFAIAAAQCVAGDVIPHSNKRADDPKTHRPMGFGVGATAKLIPVASVVTNGFGKVLKEIVMH